MSYVEILKVRPDGKVESVTQVKNAMAGALFIWDTLRTKYGVGSLTNYKPLWDEFDKPRMSLVDKIAMGMTFDRVIIRREHLPIVVKAMQQFRSSTGEGTLTLYGIEQALAQLQSESECIGVCFNQTSVAKDLWWVDDGGEEGRPYDTTVDTGHWYLFDELPPEALTI